VYFSESPGGKEERFSHALFSLEIVSMQFFSSDEPKKFTVLKPPKKFLRSAFEKKKSSPQTTSHDEFAEPTPAGASAEAKPKRELEKKNIAAGEPKRDDVARDTQTAARLTAARPRPRRSHGVVVAHAREPERALDHRRFRRATRATAPPCSPSRVAPRGARWGSRGRRWSRAW
jgi:hypothetical protein